MRDYHALKSKTQFVYHVNDGSSNSNLGVLIDRQMKDEHPNLSMGASIIASGTVQESVYGIEIKADDLKSVGMSCLLACCPELQLN